MSPVAAAVLVAAVVVALSVATQLVLRHTSLTSALDLPREKQRVFWLMIAVMAPVSAVCAWAFGTGRGALGVGVLVAVFVLPEFVLMPLRIRRSRERADAARAARQARSEREGR